MVKDLNIHLGDDGQEDGSGFAEAELGREGGHGEDWLVLWKQELQCNEAEASDKSKAEGVELEVGTLSPLNELRIDALDSLSEQSWETLLRDDLSHLVSGILDLLHEPSISTVEGLIVCCNYQ